jgi:hypothetical protein
MGTKWLLKQVHLLEKDTRPETNLPLKGIILYCRVVCLGVKRLCLQMSAAVHFG